jgi:predicted amidohydrolase
MSKVASIQMEVTSDKKTNLEKAKKLLTAAAQGGTQMAVLPEYFLADCPEKGMKEEYVNSIAETIPGPATDYLADVAKNEGIYIATGSFIVKDKNGKLTNSGAVITPKGEILGTYSKTHPEDAALKYEVSLGIQPGDEYPVFDTEIGKVGVVVDMDATTAEATRILYVQDAEIVLWPLNYSTRWMHVIDVLPQAHAMMNKLYFVSANRVGTRKSAFYGNFLYNGGSKICNPEGFDVGRADDYNEGFAIATINVDLIREWRNTIIPRDYPFRRRPQTYGALIKPWSVVR